MQNAFVAKTERKGRLLQSAAGNIELFVGAYFVTFGILASMFFARRNHPNRAMLTIGVALFGALLIFRARRLLDWNRWIFWTVVLLLISVPIAWFAPSMLIVR